MAIQATGKGGRRVSAFAVVVAALVVAAATAIAWASLTYEAPVPSNEPLPATASANEPDITAAAKPGAEPAEKPAETAKPAEEPDKSASPEKPAQTAKAAEPEKTADRAAPAAGGEPVVALSPAPDPQLVKAGTHGALPRIDEAGRTPRAVYARPFAGADRPVVALLIVGLGLSTSTTTLAINDLPGAVTLAFSPYGDGLQRYVDAARARGHEVMLELPMEPREYPRHDSGPLTLLVTQPARINLIQMERAMSRFTGYFGVVNYHGETFIANETALRPVFQRLRESGLMFLDRSQDKASLSMGLADSMNLPRAYADIWLDESPRRAAIEAQLAALEDRARQQGQAVGVSQLYPTSAALLRDWIGGLAAKGIVLAPVSALINKQAAR